MNDKPRTPEEERWRASVLDPEKARRRIKYGYVYLAGWVVFLAFWVTDVILWDESFGWADGILGVSILMGGISGLTGIINNRRIAKGRKPLGF